MCWCMLCMNVYHWPRDLKSALLYTHNSTFNIYSRQAGPVTWQNHKQWLNKVLKLCHKISKLAVNNMLDPSREGHLSSLRFSLVPSPFYHCTLPFIFMGVDECTHIHTHTEMKTMTMRRLPQNVATLVSSCNCRCLPACPSPLDPWLVASCWSHAWLTLVSSNQRVYYVCVCASVSVIVWQGRLA